MIQTVSLRALAVCVVVLALLGGVVVSVGAAGSRRAAASITSVTFGGSSKAPKVVVNGHGFGTRPGINPSYPPQQHQGCPPRKPSTDGHDFGSSLWLQDTKASGGNTPLWSAGRYTGAPELDCIGLVISSWSATRVAFRFGGEYNQPKTASSPSTYVLSKGDPFILKVRNATFHGTVTFVP